MRITGEHPLAKAGIVACISVPLIQVLGIVVAFHCTVACLSKSRPESCSVTSELPAAAFEVLRDVNVGNALSAVPLDPSPGPIGFTNGPSRIYSFPIGDGPPRPTLLVTKASPELPQRMKSTGDPTTPGTTKELSKRNSSWSYNRSKNCVLRFESNVELRMKTRPRLGSTAVKMGNCGELRVVGKYGSCRAVNRWRCRRPRLGRYRHIRFAGRNADARPIGGM